MKKYLLLTIAIAALAAGTWWLRTRSAPSASGGPGGGGTPPAPVKTALVVAKDMPHEIRTFGTVAAFCTVEVKPQITGVMLTADFAEGAEVAKNDVLFTLDDRPWKAAVKQASANLARNRVQLENAVREAARQKELFGKGLAAEEDYDRARTAVAALEAQVTADEAMVENARLQLEYCTIRAPITGRTSEHRLEPGNVARANESVLTTLQQMQPVHVDFSVPEKELPRVRGALEAGAELQARPPFGAGAGEPETGRLTFADNAVDRATGTLRLRGEFANASRRLWPGQFVLVTFVVGRQPDAVVVPAVAVQTGQKGPGVFVVRADGTAELRPVAVDRTLGEEAVIAEGVKPGEKIVVEGQFRLFPGARVQEGK